MNKHDDLIKRLRTSAHQDYVDGNLQDEAADALRALQAELGDLPEAQADLLATCKALTIERDDLFHRMTVAEFERDALQASESAAAPVRFFEAAFNSGFVTAARWANRDDLLADMDSGAYLKDRTAMLASHNIKEPT